MVMDLVNVFVSYIRRYVLTPKIDYDRTAENVVFSSPIFGDMFLLIKMTEKRYFWIKVFVSYIRRYVLTNTTTSKKVTSMIVFSSPIFGDMFLL